MKAWLWVAATSQVAVFRIASRRNREVLVSLLGEAWQGIVGSDRFSAYGHLQRRQLCWAHLCRDLKAMAERQGSSRAIGRTLLAVARWIFRDWHRFRDGTFGRYTLVDRLEPRSLRFIELLTQGALCEHAKTAGSCAEILAVADHAFTFAQVEGVEPTNNLAERSLRPAVQWRKQSAGTQSEHGSRFAERMLTCCTSLAFQRRGIYDFLVNALESQQLNTPAPSLLPDGV